MAHDDPYKRIIEKCGNWLFALPDSELLDPLLKLRFTPEEAELLSRFPHMPSTLERLTALLNIPAEELQTVMEPMIRKGLIRTFPDESGTRYAFADPMFFFFRMPGWKGQDDPWNRKIAPLINKYYVNHLGAEVLGHPSRGLRAIPVGKTIKDTRQVLPYENLLEFVEREDFHAVSPCSCRPRHRRDPDAPACKHELETCFHFGKLAHHTVEYGMARKISREETLEILKNAAEAGLVHGISNTKTGMDTLCNCCSCCCLLLEPVKMPHLAPGKHQRSNYVVRVNHDTCQACGLCEKRCPVHAIQLKDQEGAPEPTEGKKLKPRDVKEVACDPEQCLGCGVCAYKCPTQSLTLVRRADEEEDIPETFSDLGMRVLVERGRDLSKIF
jgi:NAD-dependent dihydropyrimidine dehydrogenase PreA subunit